MFRNTCTAASSVSEKWIPRRLGGDAAVLERGAAIAGLEVRGRDALVRLDGSTDSLLFERKEKRVHAAAAFLHIPYSR